MAGVSCQYLVALGRYPFNYFYPPPIAWEWVTAQFQSLVSRRL